MKYCFNCGAVVDYKTQNYCTECGVSLSTQKENYKQYRKQQRKKYNQNPGETYLAYVNRIGIPINDLPPIEEYEIEAPIYDSKMEEEKRKKELVEKLKRIEERQKNKTKNQSKPYKSEIPKVPVKSLFNPAPDEYNVIREGINGVPKFYIDGNTIRENGKYGMPKYYIDGDLILENSKYGAVKYRREGNYILEGRNGPSKYYIDGDLIKRNNKYGVIIGRIGNSFKLI